MTDRYILLINSIHSTDLFITQMFLFAIFAVLAYPVLGWTAPWLRRPAQMTYLTVMLAAFVFVTVYSWQ
jgi:hypothetical protein